MSTCDRRGVLSRSGTAQPDRDPVERDPGYFRLDERDAGDLILFGRRFARHVKYYDPQNRYTASDPALRDWLAFFERDISAILASLAKLPVVPFRAAFSDIRTFLEEDPARPEAELSAHLNAIFHLPLTLYREMAGRMAVVPAEDPLWPVLKQLSLSDIAAPLADLAAYHQGAVAQGLFTADALDRSDFTLTGQPGVGPRLTDQVAGLLLSEEAFGAMAVPQRALAHFAPDGWAAYYAAQAAKEGPYVDATDSYGKIFDALNHNLLVSTIERVFRAMVRVQAEASARLTESLEAFAGHTPHYALWLAFLTMFDRAQSELNDFTGRHLDFYYEEILRLARRGPEPDHVHVTFELAKGREAHLLPAGTGLRAGKDALGREVSYVTDEDIVVNRAEVSALRGVRIDRWMQGGAAHETLRAAPVLASLDGLGEEDLPEEAPHFAPFGSEIAPFGRMGLAVSHRQLFLREGERILVLTATLTSAPGDASGLGGMMVRLTAEEDWLELRAGDSRLEVELDGARITVTITLDGADPAIVPHDPELHEGPYPADRPAMELLFDFDGATDAAAKSFARLRGASLANVAIRSEASNLRQMSIRAADGVADPSDSFMPFGVTPRIGARWIIGSSELFAKPQAEMKIHVTWAEAYTQDGFLRNLPATSFGIGFEYLRAGKWQAFENYFVLLLLALMEELGEEQPSELGFESKDSEIFVETPGFAATDAGLVLEEPAYGAGSVTGFMRITLGNHFGHGAYLDHKTQILIEKAKPTADQTDLKDTTRYNYSSDGLTDDPYAPDVLPKEPYTPEIEEIALSYKAKTQAVDEIWHVHPFGAAARSATGPVLDPTPFEGALYVGLDALDPPERVMLLVQVADGTGDPLLAVPDLDISYLGASDWEHFVAQGIDDRTKDFTTSGVLGLAAPREARPGAGFMPAGKHWLRIAAPENAGAINRVLTIEAQAMRATFQDAGNDPAFLEVPLEPETISKLKLPDRAVKTVTQPFASFGGRGMEGRTAYHRRASERLRHKDRAVTLWDYEHLGLEAFPSLYRIKALNTTELKRVGGVVVADNEAAPGAVTVVAVPYTQGRSQLDPLRPYTDQATLTALDAHLRRRQSPFICFEVANPKFEEIHVDMQVAFLPHIADLDFYRDLVEAALIEHLTPWRQAGAQGVEFGGLVYKSTIIDFVEELPYVDYLQDVRMFHRPDPNQPGWTKVDAEIARASTARSVLVSAGEHLIGVLS
ncbi:hypothetical protein R3X27_15170 [Tropicimonas sp. TH_r6]|uniref:hypothetical protein n=1 Tax=Tropicimonas sp. TH_r6 TaxID=3082085 RepID=UPI002954C239|nr:hypothetical protein [Tropicimonas sp. TH_r6]MDV7144028.1 hypothetical protein [Tropicimonas sp. TH_r6]